MAVDASNDFTRLHIAPLSPSLLKAIIPSSLLPNAKNISYHTLETFPDRGYGYVELPSMDADKIKKKLHGSILKGTKVRVEVARPALNLSPGEEEDFAMPQKKDKYPNKKKKRGDKGLSACEIGERHVKRGWTTPASAIGKVSGKQDRTKKDTMRQVNKSKYTTKPECLFKTVLPANVAAGSKSDTQTKLGKRKRRKGTEAVVHEFSQTTKYATFLRSSGPERKEKAVARFVEGRGWIDDTGCVVEVVKSRTKIKSPNQQQIEQNLDSVLAPGKSLGNSSEDSPSAASSRNEVAATISAMSARGDSGCSNASSSDSPSSSSVSNTSDSDSERQRSTQNMSFLAKPSRPAKSPPPPLIFQPTSPSSKRPSSSNPSSGLSITIPSPIVHQSIHPLEALYKRPAPKFAATNVATDESFSFFGADHSEDGTEKTEKQIDSTTIPMTPYTQKDFEFRGVRSAAPTPDTAFANKKFVWPTKEGAKQNENNFDEDEDDESDNEEETQNTKRSSAPSTEGKIQDAAKGKDDAGVKNPDEESNFKQWFYAHRGETTRAWKKRRRTAAKDKRQRENRGGR